MNLDRLAVVIGYAVLIWGALVGMTWVFVGLTHLTDRCLRACEYSADFWDEVRSALIRRWIAKFKKEARDGA